MSNQNSQILNNLESRLMQAQSMIEIALDNHNYKNAGYDEPFIEHCKAGTLLWASSDLIGLALNHIENIELSEGKHHG